MYPDVPTVAQTVPGFESSTWYGLFAPAGTPKAVVDLLNAKANAALHTPPAEAALHELSIDAIGGRPDVLAERVRSEVDRWTAIAHKRNIHVTE